MFDRVLTSSSQETPILSKWQIRLSALFSDCVSVCLFTAQCHARSFRVSHGSPIRHSKPHSFSSLSILIGHLQSSGKWPFTIIDLIKTTTTVTLFTTLSFTLHIFLFGFMRSIILPILFKLPFLHYLLRPVSAHFLKGPWTLWLPMRHLSLVCRTFFLGLSTVANWEFAEELFDKFVAQVSCVGSYPPSKVNDILRDSPSQYRTGRQTQVSLLFQASRHPLMISTATPLTRSSNNSRSLIHQLLLQSGRLYLVTRNIIPASGTV